MRGGLSRDLEEVRHEIAWKTRGRLLKAQFPLAVANPQATYDLGLGTIRRGNRRRDSYPLPGFSSSPVTGPLQWNVCWNRCYAPGN